MTRPTPPPSTLRYPTRPQPREWRAPRDFPLHDEPRGYEPGPVRRSDLDVVLVVQAVVVFAAVVMVILLASLVAVE